ASYRLTTLPGAAVAGESLVLTVTVLDVFGNVATSYTGQMRLVATDAILPPVGAFVAGVRSVSLAFTKVGHHTAPGQGVAVAVTPPNTHSAAISPPAPLPARRAQ